MASCLKFVVDIKEIRSEIKRLEYQAELTKVNYFIEARNIQAWFRGVATLKHMRTLNAKATVIQRHWRGYQARCVARQMLVQRVNDMWKNRYDLLATRIQAAWRGYRARKTGIDFRRLRKWIASVYEKNRYCQERMRSFRDVCLQSTSNEIESQSLLWLLFILFKVHHLMGTKQHPGVISVMDQVRLTTVEKMLKCLEYKDYVEKKRIEKNGSNNLQ